MQGDEGDEDVEEYTAEAAPEGPNRGRGRGGFRNRGKSRGRGRGREQWNNRVCREKGVLDVSATRTFRQGLP